MIANKSQYGIIGSPLKHSLSPVMQNAAFKALGVQAEYKLFPLEEDELEGFFKDLRQKNSPIFGLNVTVPYKEKVLPLLDSVTPLAKKIGAVNTIVIDKSRKLIGYNTDAPGFMAHLAELGVTTKGKRIALLGAGGSARAIVTTLCLVPEQPEAIYIYNRTGSRLDEFLKDVSQHIDISIVHPVHTIEDLDVRSCDLLINATSTGMKKDDPCLIEESLLHPDLFVYDLIYNPKETLLLKMAKEAGAQTSNGLGMLFYQGVLALQHWAGIPVEESVKKIMRDVLEEAVGK
ncbi:MAG TPA: shikimate dehydrogenase [Candidatus Omnitrophota bacterium]|nr:shikimate dehydrogenase [Candidatus Omnitrophota bacterium]